jgi:hypothetical protein
MPAKMLVRNDSLSEVTYERAGGVPSLTLLGWADDQKLTT